jgi:hypothetical protein
VKNRADTKHGSLFRIERTDHKCKGKRQKGDRRASSFPNGGDIFVARALPFPF